MLAIATRIASRAAGDVEPNPLVGCVLVKNGAVIGLGHHRRFGGPHAERAALDDARARGNEPRGATAYVTLEPCRHHGKQPPCADALIDAGVAEIVYAREDPGVESGGGADILRRAGVTARLSQAWPPAAALAEPFARRLQTGRPWVIAKWAQTIDGRIATRSGESKWISGPLARRRVHRLRARVDAVLTGLGTVLADDPMLTARDARRVRRLARRVVVDADLSIPETAALVRTARDVPACVACAKDLVTAGIASEKVAALESLGVGVLGVPEDPHRPGRLRLGMLLAALADRFHAANVLVEAGAGLLGSLLEQDLVDEAVVYVAPLLLGDEAALPAAAGRVAEHLSAGRRFRLIRVKRLGDDVELTYRRVRTPANDSPPADPTSRGRAGAA